MIMNYVHQDCRYAQQSVQLWTHFQKKIETRFTKFPSFNIRMCTVYRVHFVCTLYGRKMLAALIISVPKDWTELSVCCKTEPNRVFGWILFRKTDPHQTKPNRNFRFKTKPTFFLQNFNYLGFLFSSYFSVRFMYVLVGLVSVQFTFGLGKPSKPNRSEHCW